MSHGYLGSGRFHIKHTASVVSTLELSTVVCYKCVAWTF